MGQFDRWLRRAAAAVPGEVLLATLAGTSSPSGSKGAARPCVVVATSGHVVHHVPRWRGAELTTVPVAELADVSVDESGTRLTLRTTEDTEIVVERIEDEVALEAFVAALDRHGLRHLPDDPAQRRPGHGHVVRVSQPGR